MHFGVDGKGQTYLEWEIGPDAWKRAWVQDRSMLGSEKNWAGTGRYLNVVRVDAPNSGPGGQATDFPIHSQGSDRQILRAFMFAVSAATGAILPEVPI